MLRVIIAVVAIVKSPASFLQNHARFGNVQIAQQVAETVSKPGVPHQMQHLNKKRPTESLSWIAAKARETAGNVATRLAKQTSKPVVVITQLMKMKEDSRARLFDSIGMSSKVVVQTAPGIARLMTIPQIQSFIGHAEALKDNTLQDLQNLLTSKGASCTKCDRSMLIDRVIWPLHGEAPKILTAHKKQNTNSELNSRVETNDAKFSGSAVSKIVAPSLKKTANSKTSPATHDVKLSGRHPAKVEASTKMKNAVIVNTKSKAAEKPSKGAMPGMPTIVNSHSMDFHGFPWISVDSHKKQGEAAKSGIASGENVRPAGSTVSKIVAPSSKKTAKSETRPATHDVKLSGHPPAKVESSTKMKNAVIVNAKSKAAVKPSKGAMPGMPTIVNSHSMDFHGFPWISVDSHKKQGEAAKSGIAAGENVRPAGSTVSKIVAPSSKKTAKSEASPATHDVKLSGRPPAKVESSTKMKNAVIVNTNAKAAVKPSKGAMPGMPTIVTSHSIDLNGFPWISVDPHKKQGEAAKSGIAAREEMSPAGSAASKNAISHKGANIAKSNPRAARFLDFFKAQSTRQGTRYFLDAQGMA